MHRRCAQSVCAVELLANQCDLETCSQMMLTDDELTATMWRFVSVHTHGSHRSGRRLHLADCSSSVYSGDVRIAVKLGELIEVIRMYHFSHQINAQ